MMVTIIARTTKTPNKADGISISIAGMESKSFTPITNTSTYAIVFNSGTFFINNITNSAIPRMARIPTIPPIKTTTGFDETAKEAQTESTEKRISIISI